MTSNRHGASKQTGLGYSRLIVSLLINFSGESMFNCAVRNAVHKIYLFVYCFVSVDYCVEDKLFVYEPWMQLIVNNSHRK